MAEFDDYRRAISFVSHFGLAMAFVFPRSNGRICLSSFSFSLFLRGRERKRKRGRCPRWLLPLWSYRINKYYHQIRLYQDTYYYRYPFRKLNKHTFYVCAKFHDAPLSNFAIQRVQNNSIQKEQLFPSFFRDSSTPLRSVRLSWTPARGMGCGHGEPSTKGRD